MEKNEFRKKIEIKLAIYEMGNSETKTQPPHKKKKKKRHQYQQLIFLRLLYFVCVVYHKP